MAERTLQQILNHRLTTDPPLEWGGYSIKRCDSWSAEIVPPSGKPFTVRDKAWVRTVTRIVSAITGEPLVLICQHCRKPSEKPTCPECVRARVRDQGQQKRDEEEYRVGAA